MKREIKSARARAGADGSAAIKFTLPFEADGSEYVLFPACCYNGNRFKALHRAYPPMLSPDEAKIDMPVTVTDVPRLEPDGSGEIEVTTGDVSVPCIGVYSEKARRAALLYTVQQIDGVNLGLAYRRGELELQYPHDRRRVYHAYGADAMRAEKDTAVSHADGRTVSLAEGTPVEIPYILLDFECGSMERFYRVFFENRKCMGLDDSLPELPSAQEQFEIQREKFNLMNWRGRGGFYGVGTTSEPTQTWQPGWVGGAMSGYALMKLGGELEWERGLSTLRFLFSTQTESGFFHSVADEDGGFLEDGFSHKGTERWHLIRKSADVLYFMFKYFDLMRGRGAELPEKFVSGTRRLADAFVKLWDKYGQLGQFVDVYTGDIVVGGSASGAIASAGLARAYEFFGEKRYLETALANAELLYSRDALRGYTVGGPGEALQCPDSESAFGLLESLVVLSEVTGEQKWLCRARYMAELCSSWVVSYNYMFPAASEFGRLGKKTVGSVFANAQNKHSAPGIATLSGDSLYRLYRLTGDRLYLELCRDIALTIGQYMSTDEAPIYSWDARPAVGEQQTDPEELERAKLPRGFICERVNMSDWEGAANVGGVFRGSCWSETSNLLALAEVYGKL